MRTMDLPLLKSLMPVSLESLLGLRHLNTQVIYRVLQ